MRGFGFLLRLFSYIFHIALSSFLLAAGVISQTNHQFINLGVVPLAGEQSLMQVIALGIIGLLCSLLALARTFRGLFPIWALFVAYLLSKGYLQNTYSFDYPHAPAEALWLVIAAVVAFVGAFATLTSRRARLYF